MLKIRFSQKYIVEAGCDEAGRGCLAGPVFAAAVILPRNYRNSGLNDSKKLSKKKRDALRIQIEQDALAWMVASVEPSKIDEINILKASILAMHQAVAGLSQLPSLLLIDGNYFLPYPGIPNQCIVKGDGIYMSIAAASILAKTHRDEFMQKIHVEFPDYGWDHNMGYPTRQHRDAIARLGITPWHRLTFRMSEQLKLEFSEKEED